MEKTSSPYFKIYQAILADKSADESLTKRIEKHRRLNKVNVLPTSFKSMYHKWLKRRPEMEKSVVTANKQSVVDQIRQRVKAETVISLESIAEEFEISKTKAKAHIQHLIDKGHNFRVDGEKVIYSTHIPKPEVRKLDIKKMSTGTFRFGVVGDNHLCSKYERLDVLNALYDEFEREGITVVYNTGNWIDGEARFNKHDINVHGMGNQVRYFVENYPKRKGITTYFIAGDDHEGWYTQREGIEIGKYAEMIARQEGRTDLVYLGYMEADISLKAKRGETIIRVLHPGGGSSYATSYSVQKIAESYQGGEKPHILLVGHYHKADYTYCRGIHIVQTGTTEDQTPFMRKKKLAAHLGGWIIEFSVDDNGAITRFKPEFFPFYDNGYYVKWQYKH